MTPTTRAVVLMAVCAVVALTVSPSPAFVLAALLLGLLAVDAFFARAAPGVEIDMPRRLARGVPSPFTVSTPDRRRVAIRQAAIPEIRISDPVGSSGLSTEIVGVQRGSHVLPAPVTRTEGPLGLAAWTRPAGDDRTVDVYPDLPGAARIAHAVRTGTFTEEGSRTRGALGLGTNFESLREYSPDDDIRQVNWRATARLERPMSNQYRQDQDRDVLALVDSGRLMSGPVLDRTRLDAALDALAAMGAVADVMGDRFGVLAFSDRVIHHLRPRRDGARAAIRALHDLADTPVDSDYELAFRTALSGKRALVVVFTDLFEETATRELVRAMPTLSKRHAVLVCAVTDPDLLAAVSTAPTEMADLNAASLAADLLQSSDRVAAQLRSAGATVVVSPPDRFPSAVVGAYLRLKRRARI